MISKSGLYKYPILELVQSTWYQNTTLTKSRTKMSFQTNSIDMVPKVFNEFRTTGFDFIMISRHIFPKNLNHNHNLI